LSGLARDRLDAVDRGAVDAGSIREAATALLEVRLNVDALWEGRKVSVVRPKRETRTNLVTLAQRRADGASGVADGAVDATLLATGLRGGGSADGRGTAEA
jgi:hypothetical protein